MHGSAREAKLQALLSDHSEVREQAGELDLTAEGDAITEGNQH
jgi:hypothetical protein